MASVEWTPVPVKNVHQVNVAKLANVSKTDVLLRMQVPSSVVTVVCARTMHVRMIHVLLLHVEKESPVVQVSVSDLHFPPKKSMNAPLNEHFLMEVHTKPIMNPLTMLQVDWGV